ncbi:MAG: uracil phosphoribosyltransferase, partial [Chloroflexota bacterium]|nr:uracil phosphoribosyltransferase [Chloroflexota bacterium]
MSDQQSAPLGTSPPETPRFPCLHVSRHPLVRHKLTLIADARTDSKLFRELVREVTPLLLY